MGGTKIYISLVQDIAHTVLPNIPPVVTFLATFLSMIPALVKLWLSPNSATGRYLSYYFSVSCVLSFFNTVLYFVLFPLSFFSLFTLFFPTFS